MRALHVHSHLSGQLTNAYLVNPNESVEVEQSGPYRSADFSHRQPPVLRDRPALPCHQGLVPERTRQEGAEEELGRVPVAGFPVVPRRRRVPRHRRRRQNSRDAGGL